MIKHLYKIFVVLVLAGLFNINDAKAQDIHFSQFYASPLTLNPAMTGMMDGCYRVAVNYKNQWASVPAPYNTVSASFDMPVLQAVLGRDFVGIGGMVFNDNSGYGSLNNLTAMFSLAYHKSFDRNRMHVLSLGIQGGFVNKGVNFGDLIFENQLLTNPDDPASAPNGENTVPSFSYFDLRAGGMFTSNISESFALYIGGSYYHLTEPVETFLNDQENVLAPRLVVHFGTAIRPSDGFSITPNGIYMSQGGAQEIVAGLTAGLHLNESRSNDGTSIYFGGYYRLNDAIIPLAGVEYNGFKFGLSYDINVSSATTATNYQGGVEISLGYQGTCFPKPTRSYPPVSCPRF